MEDREQQHRVGTGRPDLGELPRVDDELLGQHGDGDRGADPPQIVDRAAEPVRLAQHRDGRRATVDVGARLGDEVLAGARRSVRPMARTASARR